MRESAPVTGKEHLFPADERLVSTTDVHGNILHCNDAFVRVSGYEREELIGQPHNIVRHPDMPAQAFKVMWQHLKVGKPWMGLVKNRCKNGDHYWVDAYVSPITEDGKVVGFESVRTRPLREDVARAERHYISLRQGRPVRSHGWLKQPEPWLAIALLLAAGLQLGQYTEAALWLALGSLAAFGGWMRYLHIRTLKWLDASLGGAFRHPLATLTHSREQGLPGRILTGIRSEQARLTAIITRIDDASVRVARRSDSGHERSQQARQGMEHLRIETDQVATAMNEMTATISDVAVHVQETAGQADSASQMARQGLELAGVTREAIAGLKGSVDEISGEVQQLAGQTAEISRVAELIEVISDQTNLLALNAAIEAARAGEHGRGFAVVADEVRQLAGRTRESTGEIHRILAELSERTRTSVDVAEQGKQRAETGLARVVETEDMLSGISSSVSSIADMSLQMATALDQQSQVAEDINRQVVHMASLSETGLEQAGEAAVSIEGLQSVATELHDLVVRLQR